MKYLVTGITGFVAPHLAELLIKDGHEVVGTTRNLNDEALKIYETIGVRSLAADLGGDNFDIIMKEKFDGVFHLGAFTHPPTSFEKPEEAFNVNAMGTIRLVEAIKKYQSECVLMQCSTPEVYGICPSTSIDETTPMRPMNPYGVSKAAADMYVLEQTRNGALKGFITRAFSHTGPRRRSNYSISSDAFQIAKIIKGQQEPVIDVGNLNCKRVVIDVRDVVKAYAKLMRRHKNGEIYHISGYHIHTMGFFLDMMMNIFNVKAEIKISNKLYRKIDIPVQIPNWDKLKTVIDWKPEIPIETTLRDLVNWWLEKI